MSKLTISLPSKGQLALRLAAALGLTLIIGGLDANTGAHAGAWCSQEARGGGSVSCGYATLEQCRAGAAGNGGICSPNPAGGESRRAAAHVERPKRVERHVEKPRKIERVERVVEKHKKIEKIEKVERVVEKRKRIEPTPSKEPEVTATRVAPAKTTTGQTDGGGGSGTDVPVPGLAAPAAEGGISRE